MFQPNISVHQKLGLSSGSIPLIIDICNLLDITPNYIFKKALNTNKLNDSLEIISPETLIYYEKLKDENKQFVNNTIYHLYNMQKKKITLVIINFHQTWKFLFFISKLL